MRLRAAAAFLCALAATTALLAERPNVPAIGATRGRSAAADVIGRSVEGRAIRAELVGSPRAQRTILAVGEIHGSETAGRAVIRRLRRARPPRGVALWLIDQLNPDGARAGTRQNAHGVDLNRNFPVGWLAGGRPFDTYYPGPRPLSEPETESLAAFVSRARPRVTVWYHQAMRLVAKGGGDPALERIYSRRTGLPRRSVPRPGSAIAWQHRRLPGDTAFVVELPGGRLSAGGARRHAGAVLALARAIAPPRERRRPIPFGARRKSEMRAYARRHYGIDDWRLRRPRVIVEHYTANNSFAATWNTFAADRADPELHELPGTCAHFVVDRDGTVYSLVSTRIMCRHTVGLNWTAIGIEHVGTSDAAVMGDRRQLDASLRLTRMLQGRFRIATRNVIGHAESLSSPYHRELVAALRRQTHGDFPRPVMRRYRALLGGLPAPRSMR